MRRLPGIPPAGPMRALAAGAVVTSLGDGAWYACWVIYLTRFVHLSPEKVGVGMLVGGIGGFAVAAPLGHLADRLGPRRVLIVLLLIDCAAYLAYLQVTSLTTLLPVAFVATTADRAQVGVRSALVGYHLSGDERMHGLTYMRVVLHAGWAIGAGFAGVVLALNSGVAYHTVIIGNAVSFLFYAVLVTRVPEACVPERTGSRRVAVIHDRPYLGVVVVSAVLALNWAMLSTGIPLWATRDVPAPRWLPAVVIVINAVAIACLEMRASRRTREPLSAARTITLSGLILGVACLGLAGTVLLRGGPLVAALLGVAVVQVLGEIAYSAGTRGVVVGLMPDDLQGQYQGMATTGTATAQMVGPAIMASLIGGAGTWGWIMLSGVFILGGLPALPLVRRAPVIRARVGERGAELGQASQPADGRPAAGAG